MEREYQLISNEMGFLVAPSSNMPVLRTRQGHAPRGVRRRGEGPLRQDEAHRRRETVALPEERQLRR